MLKIIVASCLTLFTSAIAAQADSKSEVMLIGVFHFANPGLDTVKAEQINVMTDASQRYLEAVTGRLAGFSPTHVLIECLPESAPMLSAEYQDYLDGKFELTSRESHQLGFRIAQKANLTELHCYDDRGVEWLVEPMMEQITQSEPALLAAFNKTIEEFTAEVELSHQTLNLEQLMLQHNSIEHDKENKALYMSTNVAGAGDGFEGADSSASWWQRNFRMYANIQSIAQPNTRVLVIGGQGHTAILKDLLDVDEDRMAESVVPYLSH